jgi:regulator of replication initiation timing
LAFNSNKYDLFLDELNSLEKKIRLSIAHNEEITDEKKALTKKIKQLAEENNILKMQLSELENKSGNSTFDSSNIYEKPTNLEEREKLKKQIDLYISKIDGLISS